MSIRYTAESLKTFAGKLMVQVGIDPEKTDVIAEILLEGDLMGHTTHGLQMLVLPQKRGSGPDAIERYL